MHYSCMNMRRYQTKISNENQFFYTGFKSYLTQNNTVLLDAEHYGGIVSLCFLFLQFDTILCILILKNTVH